jgi:hypothetical protein
MLRKNNIGANILKPVIPVATSFTWPDDNVMSTIFVLPSYNNVTFGHSVPE